MRHPAIEPLLILQARDQTERGLSAQLAAIPTDVAGVEGRIEAEKAAIESARAEVRGLETQKKLLETEIGSAEDKLAKYRTQQMTVRKNEEYQAIGHEIETMEKSIGALEERELEIMYGIDEAKLRFAEAEKTMKANIVGYQARLKALAERKTNLAAELVEAQATVAAAREPLDERTTRLYDRTAARHMPAVVSVQRGTCSGCHLRISGEVETGARSGEELVTCDQCSRIVWFES